MDEDLKIIKKKYGEKMAHLCRELFPSLLEKEGLLSKLLLDHFEPNHNLCNDLFDANLINKFKDFIYSFIEEKNGKDEVITKTPRELLEEAGYVLFECKSKKDILKFKKYYAFGEELCTFKGDRLKYCYVFFVVKKDVDNIKRENFLKPDRQDLYGTSVLSIQFSKDESHTLSIKNRYNHTVKNPDATFGNNLDNIIPGLTESFARIYGMKQAYPNNDFEIPGYVKAADGKLYKYNYEIDNIYYCPNNIIIDNFEVKRYEKEKYLVLDYFILDLVNKELIVYNEYADDYLIDSVEEINKIEIKNFNKNKIIYITNKLSELTTLEIDENNCIISFSNENLIKIGDYFLWANEKLEKLNMPNLKIVGDNFLAKNTSLKELSLPHLIECGCYFIITNNSLKKIDLPKLEAVQNHFLYKNNSLEELSLPNLEYVEHSFLANNNSLKSLDLPKLKGVGCFFLSKNKSLINLNMSSLKTYDESTFIKSNEKVRNNVLKKMRKSF